jgi:hypothetical protein
MGNPYPKEIDALEVLLLVPEVFQHTHGVRLDSDCSTDFPVHQRRLKDLVPLAISNRFKFYTKNNTNLDSMPLPPQRNRGGEPAQARTDDKYTQGRRCRFGHGQEKLCYRRESRCNVRSLKSILVCNSAARRAIPCFDFRAESYDKNDKA